MADILALVAGRAPLLIEVKDQDGMLGPDVGPLEARVAELLAGYRGPVALMSFNPHSVAALAERAPALPRGLTSSAFERADWSLPDYRRAELASLADFDRVGAAFLSHDHRDLDSPAVLRLKAAGTPILCWTVRSPARGGRRPPGRRQRHLRGLSRGHPRLTRRGKPPSDAPRRQGMDGGEHIEVSVLGGLGEIAAAEWDACAAPEGAPPRDPFTTHRFLSALEASRSVGPGTGWMPRHLVARQGGAAIAVMPLYAKGHSQGEYIFDHNWAHAWERAGGRYYPKLQAAVPFTPATGRRLLARPGHEADGRAALTQGAIALARQSGVSSLHITFCTAEERAWGAEHGLLARTTQQFHWENHGYADFDAFLAALASRKRKAIRRERERAQAFGGEIVALTGDALEPAHWDAFWRFYQDTGGRKWGRPYLTRAFFDRVQASMRDDVVLVLARRRGRWVAGALNFVGRDTLFGRYWGCVEDHPFLHFELCYYRAIDWAIAHRLARVEAGAQGEHKLARGYLPVATHSLHWIADPGFKKAVAEYLRAEARAVDQEIEVLTAYGPFRKAAICETE